ncbi:unnamed protein product [Polarella glacialis]|nr:unnamed protein product [Polarella glacialis]
MALASRACFLVARIRLHLAGAAAAVQCRYGDADQDEEELYRGSVQGCPAYDKVPLPRTGGTVHVPRERADSGLAILYLPGKGRVFNLFPLQKQMTEQGVKIDVVGVDYCAYGAGYERNVRERWAPRLLYEMRLHEMSDALVEALEVTSGIYRKVLVVANSTAGVSVLNLLSSRVAKTIPAMVHGFWVTNPVVAFKEGHFVNAIVDASVPTWLWTFFDHVIGLGPLQLKSDADNEWFYSSETDQGKRFKECFAMPGHTSGVMVGVPRHQHTANPMRFLHVAEIVQVTRAWAQGRYKRQESTPPVWFSLNYKADEWHCGASKTRQLLSAWGAVEAGSIETHEEWSFETAAQWEIALSVLKGLVSKTLSVEWT